MSEEGVTENSDVSGESPVIESVDNSQTVAEMVADQKHEWVLDKFRTDGRSEDDAGIEQAKAYVELQKKFGSFTGAPEEYEYNVKDEWTEKGYTFDAEDPIFDMAKEMAKELGMNQEGFDKLMDLEAMRTIAINEAEQQYFEQEMKALGDNAQARVENISKWAQANLTEDHYAAFEEMMNSAASIQVMESLIAKTRSAPVDVPDTISNPGISEEDLKAMQFAKDEFGNRLINVSPEHRAKYKAAQKLFYGEGDHHEVVTG